MKKIGAGSLPYGFYWLVSSLLVAAALADTAYLVLSHYRNYTDISYSSFCALSKAINCDTVSQSPWSILWNIPVAAWGLWGYLFFGAILLSVRSNQKEKRPLWSILFLLGLFYSGAAIYFGYISATKIHSYCILCIISYAISFSLLFSSWIVRRRFDENTFRTSIKQAISCLRKDRYLKISLSILIIILAGIKLFIPHYWTYEIASPTVDNITTGITKDFHPWIGAENPALTIDEYSDYQCFQCYKMHYMLRRLIAKYPDKIRLVHHHYPMDHTVNEVVVPTPFHVGAGKMAMMAIYATARDKFWQINDILFQLGRAKKPFNTRIVAEKTGLSASELAMATRNKQIRLLLQRDIRQGMKLGITGTPSFVIEGNVYPGSIPMEILEETLQ